MNLPLSNRAKRVKPSATLALGARTLQLKAEGKDIIKLDVGEPDFDTPDFIKEAAITAIKAGFTKYTAVDGTPQLKSAIIKKLSNENNLHYEPKQIIASCGVKQGLYNLMQALLNEGDEVIIPAPYWVSYPEMVILADAKPVFIETTFEQHFKISPEQLEAAITPKTRLFIINSPSNPSGVAYSKEELLKLGEVLLRHPQVVIATDDMYEHILWTQGPFVNILNACPALYDRTIVFNGVSKSYAMTGWRIGYAAGPTAVIASMNTIQSQSTSNPNSIAQIAAQAALEGDQTCVHEMTKSFHERHEFVFKALTTLPEIQCHPSDGTFYIFPKVQTLIDEMPTIKDDIAFAEYLLDQTGVAVVPGSPFGAPGCIRISFATKMELLKEALTRMYTLFG